MFSCESCQRSRPVPRMRRNRQAKKNLFTKSSAKVRNTTAWTERGALLPASTLTCKTPNPENNDGTETKTLRKEKGDGLATGNQNGTDHMAGRRSCTAVSYLLHVKKSEQPASKQLRALFRNATKRILNRVKSVFVRILPEITACPANAERSTSDDESFHEKFGKVKTHDCLD